MSKITLKHGEHILAVVPEYASGSGWANSPLFIYISDAHGDVRTVCLQPQEQTEGMHYLFPICATANAAMLGEVEKIVRRMKR